MACPNCGIDGIHACIGKPSIPTPEDSERMRTTLNKIFPKRTPEESRQHTLDQIKKFQDADAELRRVCAEKGLEVPVMVI